MKCPRVEFSVVVYVEFLGGGVVEVIPLGLGVSLCHPVSQRFF